MVNISLKKKIEQKVMHSCASLFHFFNLITSIRFAIFLPTGGLSLIAR